LLKVGILNTKIKDYSKNILILKYPGDKKSVGKIASSKYKQRKADSQYPF